MMIESVNIDNVKSIKYVPFVQTNRFKTMKFHPCIRITKKFPFIKLLKEKDCKPEEISFCIWDDWGNYSPEDLKKLDYTLIDEKIYINPHILIKYMDGSIDRIYFETEEVAKQKCSELMKRNKHKIIQLK
jgi:hypothetical protein